jgi:hypothetical protein
MNIKVQFSEGNGFYLSIPADAAQRSELPTYFINIVQRKKQLHFTSIELVSFENLRDLLVKFFEIFTLLQLQLNYRVSESLSEIYRHSDRYQHYQLICGQTTVIEYIVFSFISEILDSIRNSIHILYNISEAIALLDMCVAFTYMFTVADYGT